MDIEDYKEIGESSGRCRAKIYEMLEQVFVCMPDAGFIEDIISGIYDGNFNAIGGIGNLDLRRGVSLLESYLSGIKSRLKPEVIEEIAVDRTRILRVTSDRTYRLPYESLYTASFGAGDVVSQVRDFYIKAGIVPGEDAAEMPDYLGVEIDFMYQLCLREIGSWTSRKDAGEVISLEKEFMETHLGKWAGLYCEEAGRYCLTDYYRGFLKILVGFIKTEMEYLSCAGV